MFFSSTLVAGDTNQPSLLPHWWSAFEVCSFFSNLTWSRTPRRGCRGRFCRGSVFFFNVETVAIMILCVFLSEACVTSCWLRGRRMYSHVYLCWKSQCWLWVPSLRWHFVSLLLSLGTHVRRLHFLPAEAANGPFSQRCDCLVADWWRRSSVSFCNTSCRSPGPTCTRTLRPQEEKKIRVQTSWLLWVNPCHVSTIIII